MNALETLIGLTSSTLNCSPADIDPDAPLDSLGLDPVECQDIFEEACETHDASVEDIMSSMPMYRFKRGDTIMSSLSEIAAFSPKAAEMLADYTTRVNVDTLRSMSLSIEQGRYVASGQMSENLHQPNTPMWVIGKGAVLAVFSIGIPLMNAFGPCNPLCRDCFAPPSEKFWEIGMYTLPAMAFIAAFWFGPGLYEMWAVHNKRKSRGLT